LAPVIRGCRYSKLRAVVVQENRTRQAEKLKNGIAELKEISEQKNILSSARADQLLAGILVVRDVGAVNRVLARATG